MKKNAEFLASYIKEITGYELATATGQPGKGISLVIDQSIQNPEGYQLTVSDNGIRIAGSTDAGVFYGIQTLRKSIPATAQGMNVELPAATINDYPRFAYRGMMLDVSRHFFPVDSVKRISISLPCTTKIRSTGICPMTKVGVSRSRNIRN